MVRASAPLVQRRPRGSTCHYGCCRTAPHPRPSTVVQPSAPRSANHLQVGRSFQHRAVASESDQPLRHGGRQARASTAHLLGFCGSRFAPATRLPRAAPSGFFSSRPTCADVARRQYLSLSHGFYRCSACVNLSFSSHGLYDEKQTDRSGEARRRCARASPRSVLRPAEKTLRRREGAFKIASGPETVSKRSYPRGRSRNWILKNTSFEKQATFVSST